MTALNLLHKQCQYQHTPFRLISKSAYKSIQPLLSPPPDYWTPRNKLPKEEQNIPGAVGACEGLLIIIDPKYPKLTP